MSRSWLDQDTDQDTADRMLTGRVAPDDAPPGYAPAAAVLSSLTAEPTAGELVHEPEAIAAAVRVLGRPAPSPVTARRSNMRFTLRHAKIAGLLVLGTLAGTTGLAAANVLPDAAQGAVSDALSHVGIEVPDAPDAAGAVERPASTGEEISEIATTTEATGVDKGAEISSAASGGMSQAGQHGAGVEGAGAGSAVVDTPNAGGTGTAGVASGGADQTGADNSAEHSGGHSAAGSGNAP